MLNKSSTSFRYKSSKPQAPSTRESSGTKSPIAASAIEAWRLTFPWGLEIGFWNLSALDPPHRFLRQLIERGYRQFQMLFLRVFDLVMADAVQALREHHHRRHTGTRDFCGIVQRARWHPMGFCAGLANRFFAKIDKIFVKQNRLDAPNPFPGKIDISFSSEFLACAFCFAQHSRERAGIEMALIQRDPAFFDHACDDARFGCAGTDRANAAVAALGDAINFGTHFGRGEKRVTSPIHRRAAGMRGLTAKGDRMTLDAEGSEDNAEREIEIEKHRALFDVQLEISRGITQLFA